MRVLSKTNREIVVEPETPDEIAMVDKLVQWRFVEVKRRRPQQMLNTLNQPTLTDYLTTKQMRRGLW